MMIRFIDTELEDTYYKLHKLEKEHKILQKKHAKATNHVGNLKKEVESLKYGEVGSKTCSYTVKDGVITSKDDEESLKNNNLWEEFCMISEKVKLLKEQIKRNNTAKKLWALRDQVKQLKEESQKNREEIKEELKNEFLEKISDGIGQVFKMGVDCGSDEKKIELKEINQNLQAENEKLKEVLKKIKSMSHYSDPPISLSEIWLFIDKIL